MWDFLESIFAPRKAGAHFNAYKTLTSIHLREDESLMSLTGRVSAAMRLLKDSRSVDFHLTKADEELQSVVLLMKDNSPPMPITRHLGPLIRKVTPARSVHCLALHLSLPKHPHHLHCPL
ncbi:hypothetical protein K438DRAFT_1825242 [Mycena galopus ATCC 62051]|nr:hypothetical protein K438DRAFT_1825242 [Mycena galopus ATCC 62051]